MNEATKTLIERRIERLERSLPSRVEALDKARFEVAVLIGEIEATENEIAQLQADLA